MEDIENQFKKVGYELNQTQKEQLEKYLNLLIEWNQKFNLTAITQREDIILKHFIDSSSILKYINDGMSVIDVGTGAGFPGIVLKILNPSLKIVLLDSLEKKVNFLNFVIEELGLKDIKAIHGRAEELAKQEEYRETFDIGTSRAVAKLSILDELLLPFVKVGGKVLVMKSANANIEIEEAKNGIVELGGKIEEVDEFNLLETDNKRVNIVIEKKKQTNLKYPRPYGKIKKKQL